MAKGKKTGGRTKGVPNKATRDLKEAIAYVVNSTSDRVLGWLERVAEGEKEPVLGDDGQPELDFEGNPKTEWLRRPEPGTAVKLWTEMAEFIKPKLARTEHTGEDGKAIPVKAVIEFVNADPHAIPRKA